MKKFNFFLSCAASAMFAIALTSCEAVKDNPGTGRSLQQLQMTSSSRFPQVLIPFTLVRLS